MAIPLVLKNENDALHLSINQRINRLYQYCHDRNPNLDCSSCGSGEAAKSACHEYTISQLGELLMDITGHFIAEENCMKSLGVSSSHHSLFLDHKKDHSDLVELVSSIVTKSSELYTSDIVKSLTLVLLSRFEHHENTYDKQLMSLILDK